MNKPGVHFVAQRVAVRLVRAQWIVHNRDGAAASHGFRIHARRVHRTAALIGKRFRQRAIGRQLEAIREHRLKPRRRNQSPAIPIVLRRKIDFITRAKEMFCRIL